MRAPRVVRRTLATVLTVLLTLVGLGLSARPAAAASILGSAANLTAGSSLVSADGSYILTMQTDCNLVIYKAGVAKWWTSTGRADAHCWLAMQSDGNLVLYSSANQALWWTNTQGYDGATLTLQNDGNLVVYRTGVPLWSSNGGFVANKLWGDSTLTSGQAIYSPNHIYRLVMQSDCNLVEYQGSSAVVWNLGSVGNTSCRAVAQSDGNFVLYSSANVAIWWTGTSLYHGATLVLSDDGKLQVVAQGGAVVWSAVTVAPPVSPPPTGVTSRQDLAPAVAAATNAQRVANGLAPLTVKTCSVPAAFAVQLATENALYHNNLLTALSGCGGGTTAGENVARGYTTVDGVTAGWMGSPGHRANILNASYKSIFVGVAQSANGTYYWVENFTG